MVRRSSWLQRSPETRNSHEGWDNPPKSYFSLKNFGRMSREKSIDSHTSEQIGDSNEDYLAEKTKVKSQQRELMLVSLMWNSQPKVRH